jgi:hypothetical protein
MRLKLRPKLPFNLLRRTRRKSPPDLWQFGLAVHQVIAVRTALAMIGKLSTAEARRMIDEKRLAALQAQFACTKAILKGRGASAPNVCFDVYKRAVKSNRKRLTSRGRRWPRIRF